MATLHVSPPRLAVVTYGDEVVATLHVSPQRLAVVT